MQNTQKKDYEIIIRPKFGYMVQLSPNNHKTDLQHSIARLTLSLVYLTPFLCSQIIGILVFMVLLIYICIDSLYVAKFIPLPKF